MKVGDKVKCLQYGGITENFPVNEVGEVTDIRCGLIDVHFEHPDAWYRGSWPCIEGEVEVVTENGA